MATTFNDALQLFNVGTSSTTNINEGNIVIPEGSETLSDLIKLNYDFKDTPFNPDSRSYNIYIWNNNTDGEIRFYTKDAKNNNDFNKDYFSGNYSEPRLNFNTKIGKNGKLYFWHNFNLQNPAKLSGWYEIANNISSMEAQITVLEVGLGAAVSGLVITNNNLVALTTRVTATEASLTSLGSVVVSQSADINNLIGRTDEFLRTIDIRSNPEARERIFNSIVEMSFNQYTPDFTAVQQLARIQASSSVTAYRLGIMNKFIEGVGVLAFGTAVLAGIKYIADTQQKENYSTELIRITDTTTLRAVSSANNTLIHTGITILSGSNNFPLTNNEFIITIQKNAVLIIGIDIEGIANILLVDQIGDQPFSVNESISINRTLLNGSAGNLVLTVSSLGTLKQWTELKTTYLQNKISKIDTKTRRKANVIGYDDINNSHFTKVNTTYTDYDGNSSETITYKTLEINPNYKSPTAIEADSATNADTAAVAVKLQTKRKIANVDFDGTANIDISYNNLTNKPTSFTGNIGIGTVSSSYNLDIYDQATARIRIQSSNDVGSTSSIEFRKGVEPDVWSDYRLINDNSTFKLQYENNEFPYADATNITTWNKTNIINNIQTQFNANVGIGTIPSVIATIKLDVLGDIKATEFRGGGANITGLALENIPDIPATKITSGTLHNDRLSLTGPKVYDGCENTTFILNPSNKVDIPPVYSFNITAFDRLANTTATYLEAGKFTCTYEDRNGTYKLIPSYIPNPNNKVILNYRVGDKIVFKHTANTQYDYTEVPQQRWARLSVFKMPSNIAWTSQGQEISYMTPVIDWDSDSSSVLDWTGISVAVYPRNTPVTMQIQAGFKYFFVKWQRNNDANLYDSYITPATEASGMNIAYGGGQGFKISGDYSGSGGYKPTSSSLPPLMTTDTEGTARRGSRLSIDNGVLSADIPTSADLITNMNTMHFTNNLATSKIDISSSYVAPNATKLQTIRNIAGVGFDGSAAIDIPYDNLTGKPGLFSGAYNDLSGKPTLFSGAYNDLSGKPNLFSGSYTDLTNKLSAGSGITIDNTTISATAQTPTSASLINILNSSQFSNNTGTSKIDLVSIPYYNLTYKIGVGNGLAISTGSATTNPIITLNLSAGGDIAINNGVNPATIGITYTSANLIGAFSGQFTDTLNKISLASIPYYNLINKLSAGSGITITEGSAVSSPVITASGFTSVGLSSLFNATQFTNNVGTSKIDMASGYKPASAGTADTLATARSIGGTSFNGSVDIAVALATAATTLATARSIGGTSFNGSVDIAVALATAATTLATARSIGGTSFNGSADINISYFNLINKITVGNGLAITLGSAILSPNITLNLSAGTDIAINTGVNPATIGVSYTSANLIGVFNTTDFVNTASKITLSQHTSNYVARVNTELTTAIGGKQATINSTANQIIIGNGNGATTTNAGLTWTGGNTLNATNIAGAGSAITALNMGNAGSGTLAVARGGTGAGTFTAGGLLIGNTTSAFSQATGLTWTTATNLLTATNIAGAGSGITALNMGNAGSGILSVSRGGLGTDTVLDTSILVGAGANAVQTYGTLTYDYTNRTLKSDRITGYLPYTSTNANITEASVYISSTPTTDAALTKNIKTKNGEYIISASSAGYKLENIYDNNSATTWQTGTSSYVKQASGFWTTGTNFPTTHLNPTTTIYGEWIQVKFPRRTCVDDIRVLPLAGATYPNSIYEWYLLATNDVTGTNWIRIYYNFKTFLTSSEQNLLPALGNTNTTQYLYYRLVVSRVLGTAGAATGSTLSLIFLNLKFLIKDTLMYNDAVVLIGEPIATAPAINTILNVNGGVDINGDLNLGLGSSFRINGTPFTGSKWTAGTPSTDIYYNLGNVGIGNTAPTGTLCLGNSAVAGSDGFLLIGKNNGAGGARTQRIGYNSSFDLTIGDYGGGTGAWVEAIKFSYAAPANSLVVNGSGNVYGGSLTSGGDLSVGGTSYLRSNTYIYSGNEGSGIALYFGTPFTGTPNGASKGAIIAEAISSWSRHNLCFCLNTDADNGTNAGTGNSYMKLHSNGYIECLRAFYYSQGGGFGFRTNATGAFSNQVNFNDNGNNYQSNNSYYWTISSDERIKDDITEADYETCYNNISKLKLKRYKYKKGVNQIISKDKYKLGFIAQEVKELFPKCIDVKSITIYDDNNEVFEVIEDCLSVDAEQINMSLYGAFKHSINIIKSQDERIKELETKVERLLNYISL